MARFLVKFDLKKKKFQTCAIMPNICKRQFNALAPLYLEGGSFVGPRIHIAQKLQWRTKKKKTKDKGS